MAKAYTKEFLVAAYLSRYLPLGTEAVESLRVLADVHYDRVGRDKFRTAASLDSEAIKKFKLEHAGVL
jgi:hypothetical protein